MTEQVHGHEVMKMMIEDGRAFSKASLRDAIVERFGADARFHTCSAENMTADELIVFLEDRGKFVATEAGFNTASDRICDH